MKALWPRCALYAGIGLALLIAAVMIMDRMNTP